MGGGAGTPGCLGDNGGGQGAFGFIRIEAFDTGNLALLANLNTPVSIAKPTSAIPLNAPQLKIATVAGVAPPDPPLGSLAGPPDIVLPTTQTNPVDVVIQGSNLPVGTVVQVTLTPENGARTTVQSTPLAGTVASSSATGSVTLPTTGISVITATATIDLTLAKAAPCSSTGSALIASRWQRPTAARPK